MPVNPVGGGGGPNGPEDPDDPKRAKGSDQVPPEPPKTGKPDEAGGADQPSPPVENEDWRGLADRDPKASPGQGHYGLGARTGPLFRRPAAESSGAQDDDPRFSRIRALVLQGTNLTDLAAELGISEEEARDLAIRTKDALADQPRVHEMYSRRVDQMLAAAPLRDADPRFGRIRTRVLGGASLQEIASELRVTEAEARDLAIRAKDIYERTPHVQAMYADKLDRMLAAASAPREAPRAPAVRSEAVESASKGSTAARVGRALMAPFRELGFLGRTFVNSLTKPTWVEAGLGLATKGPVFGLAAAWWGNLLYPGDPIALGAALGLSLALETYHGLFIRSWLNVQRVLERDRGPLYQQVFNLAYTQGTAAAFRTIMWSARPNETIPVWSLEYLRDIGIMTVAGTFFGTLGYNGCERPE